ncbi:MAG: AAA family ATPase [Gemmatimonadales bacterium]
MQITRLRLVNFRQHEDTELVLGPGLTGIIGPNGAGKSTLLEAIAFALYGVPAVRGNRDSIRRRGAPPRSPVRVELDFALGAHQYRVARTLSNAELHQDADAAPIANSLQTVTERLQQLLGMVRSEFFNTYFTGQKELAVMAELTGPARAEFLNRVLGYERLRGAQDLLKEQRSSLRGRLQGLESGLPDPAAIEADEIRAGERLDAAVKDAGAAESALQAAEAKLNEVRPRAAELSALRERVVALTGDLRLAEHKVAEARDRFQLIDRQLAEAVAAKTRLAPLEAALASLPGLKVELEALDRLAEAEAVRNGAVTTLTEVRSRREGIQKRIAQLPADGLVQQAAAQVSTVRTQLDDATRQAEELRNAWVRDKQDVQTKLRDLLEQHEAAQEQKERLEAAGVAGDCPTCGRPLGDHYDQVYGVVTRQLEAITSNGQYYRQREVQLRLEPSDLTAAEQARAELERALGEATTEQGRLQARSQERPALNRELAEQDRRIAELEGAIAGPASSYDPDRHRTLRDQVRTLAPVEVEAARLRGAADRAEALVVEAEGAERALSELEAQAKVMKTELDATGFREELFAAARAAVEAADKERQEAQLRLERARYAWDAAMDERRRVQQRREERAAREEEVRVTRRDAALREELDRAFSDLRTDLNAQLRPELSEIGSQFLRDLTRGRYTDLELDEDYRATLVEDGEAKPVISGGEEDVVNLALRLAISQMIADRAGQPLSLLVLDEVFGSLDEEHRGAVLDLLRGLADRFPQVILITHIESLRDGLDRVLRVSYDTAAGTAHVADDQGEIGDGLAA